ncbi:enhanced serine sensitivity protein SseB C-terminal domain-containing protein [Carboxylicivirga linearis]|uniref:Enhanced serine sensitivity protein SseB C-terminal domain-containing protein n=1 Tax=Carboxylicivirga linearis TaxID=1628157 RepID=A0ABS5K128_9BACT|nr:enhanced serine sensitivity protein SseB C-terminal domain-containing protein [Carboxylicivirga linearis]MBS2100829.1 enhanced serine sensitivity protein SseB C-terminal domain-containing protein [Carboxylicivirga linearis]
MNERQQLTRYIKHLAESANFKVGTFNIHRNGLIGNRLEMPNVSYTHPLPTITPETTMRLFDRLKKKKTDTTFPENELEKLLIRAASDASARNDFYTKLLWSELIVITNGQEDISKGAKVLEKDTTVQFVTFENGHIPLFTSTNRIFDKGVVKEQVPFMVIKGQDLFDFTRGATFILNPYSDYGKELIPQEIESLLNGSIYKQNDEMTIQSNTEVHIGQPANYPDKLVNELKLLFKNRPFIKAAYLAAIKMDNNEKLPHLVIAIDLEGELRDISKEAGPLVEKFLDKNEIVDFMQIDNKGGISDYFISQTKPFYERQ